MLADFKLLGQLTVLVVCDKIMAVPFNGENMSDHRIVLKRFQAASSETIEGASREQALAVIRNARFDRTVQSITVHGSGGCVYDAFRPLPHMSIKEANSKILASNGPPRDRLTLGRAGEKTTRL